MHHPGDDWVLQYLAAGMVDGVPVPAASIDLVASAYESDPVLAFGERFGYARVSSARRRLRWHLDRLVKVGALETCIVTASGEFTAPGSRDPTRWRTWSIAGWTALSNMSDETVLQFADPHMASCATNKGDACDCADWGHSEDMR